MLYQKPVKFLLVDDLEANLVALEGLLKRDGLELLMAKSGTEALEILLVHEVALAFVDVQMPEMSGFELAEIMRGTERTRRTPIIFLTAGTVDHERRIRGYETGAIDFLPKPIDPTILLNKAGIFYDLARQRQELLESELRLQEANDKLEWSNSELERADKSKDQFLAMLAHELRNPIAPVLTGIDILLASPGDAAVTNKICGMMKRQVHQMAHLIDDLLDVSRITNGKIELKKEDHSVAEIIGQAVESVQPQLERFGHHFTIDQADAGLRVVADRHRLTQVVSNLLSNSAKYTPPGGRIELEVDATEDGWLIVSVKDNGQGISKEHLSCIFDLFDQGASGPQDGLGIGLTLVRSLVEMHGGRISASSDGPGRGSEFTVEMPNARSSPVTEDEDSEAEDENSASEKMRVLVADDGRATADILGMFFKLEGMETEVVYDGQEALNAAERLEPHLACLDLGMPHMDGYEAARRMRESWPDMYIVALSGWGSEKDRMKTKEAGFNEHLVKPVNPKDLRDLLARLTKVAVS